MAELYTFPTVIEGTPEELPIDPLLIEMLERMLKLAQAGKIRAAGLVLIDPADCEPITCYHDDNGVLFHELNSGVDFLKQRMLAEYDHDNLLGYDDSVD
jgi:hypothetical protein